MGSAEELPPKVALLMPVFNEPEEASRSLLGLSNEIPLDVVVVDDGSSPPLTLPEPPPPHRLILLRLERNVGITQALNHGLRYILEKGYSYVARLDAGDIALPGRFLKQVRFLEENPDYALVGGQVLFVDPSGRETHQEFFPTQDADIRRVLHARNPFIHPAVTIRTQALREVGLYSERYPAAEDYELFWRIAKRFKVANLGEKVTKVVVNPQGISIKKRRRQLLTRIKILLENFDPRLKESWLGLAKNLALLVMPTPWVQTLKRWIPGRRGWF